MADFNIKEIESLKLKIQVVEKLMMASVAFIIFRLYYDWSINMGILLVLLGVIQIFRSRFKKQLKQKEYLAKIVEERTIELRVQRDQVMLESEELSKALAALAEAQDELVRNERLATVGHLTKGLVDRILNPLNYINNFATLSIELASELKKNVTDERVVMPKELYEDSIEVLDMIAGNLRKINEHGVNTVRIVKAMEELLKDHRGKVNSADINNLCRVNLDLLSRQYEQEIQENGVLIRFERLALSLIIDINIEQMSKVLYHVFQNSLYALLKKAEKQVYDPELYVKVERRHDMVYITIRDNGIGIEEGIKNKIFEPFFTTKPTSEGAGIGLYLSQEIVLNHRGTISVMSEKDKYTEVLIAVPIHQAVEDNKKEEIPE